MSNLTPAEQQEALEQMKRTSSRLMGTSSSSSTSARSSTPMARTTRSSSRSTTSQPIPVCASPQKSPQYTSNPPPANPASPPASPPATDAGPLLRGNLDQLQEAREFLSSTKGGRSNRMATFPPRITPLSSPRPARTAARPPVMPAARPSPSSAPPAATTSPRVTPPPSVSVVESATTAAPPLEEVTNTANKAVPPHLRGKTTDAVVAPAASTPSGSTLAETSAALKEAKARIGELEGQVEALEKEVESLREQQERHRYLGTDHENVPFTLDVHSPIGLIPAIQVSASTKCSSLIARIRSKANLEPAATANPRIKVNGIQMGHLMKLGELGVRKDTNVKLEFSYSRT